jgi:hypothetical protein
MTIHRLEITGEFSKRPRLIGNSLGWLEPAVET